MGIDSTTETLESYLHPDSSKDMKLQERQTIVVVIFLYPFARGVRVLHIVAEVAERRAANANMNKAKLSPTPKNAPLNRFRDSKGTGRVDNTSLRTNAAGTDAIV